MISIITPSKEGKTRSAYHAINVISNKFNIDSTYAYKIIKIIKLIEKSDTMLGTMLLSPHL